mmetsp:Transcript_64609/g.189413  ORF Transcript_64609/g.189413 Transcript_64609/m.189413 type:complete len:249 (+) Transcript_64609:2456-3202(+)
MGAVQRLHGASGVHLLLRLRDERLGQLHDGHHGVGAAHDPVGPGRVRQLDERLPLHRPGLVHEAVGVVAVGGDDRQRELQQLRAELLHLQDLCLRDCVARARPLLQPEVVHGRRHRAPWLQPGVRLDRRGRHRGLQHVHGGLALEGLDGVAVPIGHDVGVVLGALPRGRQPAEAGVVRGEGALGLLHEASVQLRVQRRVQGRSLGVLLALLPGLPLLLQELQGLRRAPDVGGTVATETCFVLALRQRR